MYEERLSLLHCQGQHFFTYGGTFGIELWEKGCVKRYPFAYNELRTQGLILPPCPIRGGKVLYGLKSRSQTIPTTSKPPP
ncbi:hypothetical protein P154DRAFT_527613 [Amniculicola lignicola CBS 123094]|uniref:Uncharacterized protein n=1 Tax=Amniculicola lignicola CBS 123094 TaxID=1392246 RepID=A0A6A5VYD8_9PLEO|nr:hypothetical protein P154DRAFT_527613 [Amniculicola lignicola CBS 123094]